MIEGIAFEAAAVRSGLLLVFLRAYEALALWDSPWWTAWIAVGYVVGPSGDPFSRCGNAALAPHRLPDQPDSCSQLSRAFKALAPWAVLIVLLFAAGVWIVLQPGQMRAL